MVDHKRKNTNIHAQRTYVSTLKAITHTRTDAPKYPQTQDRAPTRTDKRTRHIHAQIHTLTHAYAAAHRGQLFSGSTIR